MLICYQLINFEGKKWLTLLAKMISGDFDERQFDDGQFDEFKLGALQINEKYNLAK